jgi:hypothetical protein
VIPHNAASDQLPGHHTSAGPNNRYGVREDLFGRRSAEDLVRAHIQRSQNGRFIAAVGFQEAV